MQNVRIAIVNDASALSALVNSAFRGESSRRGWTTEADLLGGQRTDAEMIEDWIQSPRRLILLMEDLEVKQHPLACVSLEKLEGSETARLGMLTVSPELQARGFGRRMLQEAEHFARQKWGSSLMEMQVIAGRGELIDWYLRLGYELTRERRHFPYGNERMGLPLRDDLEFVVLERPLQKIVPL